MPYRAFRKQRHPPFALPNRVDMGFYDNLWKTKDTSQDLRYSLEANFYNSAIPNRTDPLFALLEIIRQDIIDSFALMGTTLEGIHAASMDDFMMQKNLSYWRILIKRMQNEVENLTANLKTFVKETGIRHTADAQGLVDDVEKEAEKLMDKVRGTTSGLQADMSILESRRGIAQAEGVTRLTELAFIFIPITFVSSSFSMQIKELESGVPLTTFIQAAVITTVVIYSARILIATAPSMKRAILAKARTKYNLSSNDPVPFFKFISTVVSEVTFADGQMWLFWVALSAVALSVIPVALLWTRKALDVSFKAVGTIILVPTGFTFIWLLASYLNVSDNGPWWSAGALQARMTDWIRQQHGRRRRERVPKADRAEV